MPILSAICLPVLIIVDSGVLLNSSSICALLSFTLADHCSRIFTFSTSLLSTP
ncbi:hypothetical protein RAMDARK_1230 [Rickettsia amblyommatis str. Darkwater]|nr:hypothetical protein RAMDARK_1230 [Rickettsia amblyommatis str. Darkwater]